MFKHEPVFLEEMKSVTTESGRKYLTPDGNEFPSITTVLSVLSKKELFEWRQRVGEEEANRVSRKAATRGTAVHKIIEDYINNDPRYKNKHMPHIIASFNDVKPILDERIGLVYSQEAPLYSNVLGVAGRVDCVAEFDGVPSIIDFKTSRRVKEHEKIHSYFMQETAYSLMWKERTNMDIKQLVTIIAVDSHEPQVFIERPEDWIGDLVCTIIKYRKKND